MSHVVHMVPVGSHHSACGFNVYASETKRIATSLAQVTCAACKRTLRYQNAVKREEA